MPKDNSEFFKKKNSWSLIKDTLLGCYLLPYLQKVLATRKPICYVDCFAGKGKFEDGQPGSPIIALKARDDCLKRTKMDIDVRSAIDMTFIDLNYADNLQMNLASYNNFYGEPHIVSGRYEENIIDILKEKQGQNVFLYIDPYGIKALNTKLFDEFQTMGFNTFEMLINFNSFGFFRDACRVMKVDYCEDAALTDLDDLVEYDPTVVTNSPESAVMLTNIAGGDYWKEIVRDYKAGVIDGYKAEQRLSTEYKQRLKTRYKYVLDMPIRLKSGARPKYRMIHVSDHEDGCFLMAQNMQSRKEELYINIQTGGQMSIFDYASGFCQTIEGEWISRDEVKQKILEELNSRWYEEHITKFLASFVNQNGLICDFKMIQEILTELKSEGIIDIIRYPATTPKTGKESTFWEEKNNKTVIIRRLR